MKDEKEESVRSDSWQGGRGGKKGGRGGEEGRGRGGEGKRRGGEEEGKRRGRGGEEEERKREEGERKRRVGRGEFTMLPSHVGPLYSGVHKQRDLLSLSSHVAEFLQGLGLHLSTTIFYKTK